MEKPHFISGKPVWIEGREKEMNLFVGFRAIFTADNQKTYALRIAAASFYRFFLNNEFIGFGPARGPHDFYRVDEWILDEKIISGENLIAIEVAGYNSNGYYVLNQPSFLQAEIICDGKPIASTGTMNNDFTALVLKEHVQKVQRFSFQRPFIEIYDLQTGYDKWRKDIKAKFRIEKCSIVNEKKLIPRRVAYPKFAKRPLIRQISSGEIDINNAKTEFLRKRELTEIGPLLHGYPENELETIPFFELQKIRNINNKNIDTSFDNDIIALKEKSFRIFDFGTNLTGFLGSQINCIKNTYLYIVFDEILLDGDVDFKRADCCACLTFKFTPGIYDIESFEPYTMRYIKFMVMSGECEINNVYIKEYTNPDVYESQFSSSDPVLNKLFEAGRETFRQNALDIFMDCPSRERAGWLCDSFFTSRVAMDVSGHTKIEKNFLENFLLPENFAHHPDGMLPMCYPAEHYDGRFIPNWAMWFVIQLEEYLNRSGDRQMVDSLKHRVINLLEYFKKFRNEDGLLEKLESWIFVEWSKANDFVQDVNYPTNMLYAATLEAAGRIYNIPEYLNSGKKIKEVILKQSYDGKFFIDNAVRKESKLEITGNKTEVCQYYAFYFNIASSTTHTELWNIIKNDFGPKRDTEKIYPDVYIANAFIGNYLRFEILSRYGAVSPIIQEIKDYFLYMADMTGTLWEFVDTRASCNHGFASHICHIFYRDILGIYKIDYQNKDITLNFSKMPLDWCEGRIPIGNSFIYLKWWITDKKTYYKINFPADYKVLIAPDQPMEITRVN